MCILVNGQIAKEFPNGTTLIPFGSEYTIRFRNKNSRRAVVKFTIDDENASSGGYIIPGNDFIDIRRYAHKDVAFKFVDLNSPEAIDFGKNDNKDKNKGVIEAKFYLEKEVKYHTYNSNPVYWQNHSYPPLIQPLKRGGPSIAYHQTISGSSFTTCDSYTTAGSVSCFNPITTSDGATVEGSQTGQFFNYQHINLENDYVAVKTCLQGYASENNDKDYWIPKRAEELEEENKKLKLEITEKLKLEALERENKSLKEELERLKNG
jgi:hypothetical protein